MDKSGSSKDVDEEIEVCSFFYSCAPTYYCVYYCVAIIHFNVRLIPQILLRYGRHPNIIELRDVSKLPVRFSSSHVLILVM